jgi:NAD(P)-dependent dehydrogenase (short-subunit alcohol dehydrogenase family)
LTLAKQVSKFDKVIGIYRSNKPTIKIKNVTFVQCDILDERQLIKLDKHIKNKEQLILISAAAVKFDNLLINLSLRSWKQMIETNLGSNFLICKYLIKKMILSKFGRIIFFSSTGAKRGDPGTSAYSASKTGLNGLSKVISKEYGRYNITSNILELGAFKTGMYKDLSKKQQKKIIDKLPNKKLGSVTEITFAIKFLINSNFVNGSVIKIDGGAD